jgi:predicted ATPase/DNA-binding SARP family transcriptional activator/class 3 adenylate cyclase
LPLLSRSIHIGLLGPLRVEVNSTIVGVAAPKQRALLAVLALRAPRAASVDQLTDALWGEQPPVTSTKSLHTYVSALRRTLPEGTIETVPGGYRLTVSAEAVDANHFGRELAAGRSRLDAGEAAAAVERLQRGLGRWRGPPLTDLAAHPFGRAEVSRLEELRRAGEEDLNEGRLLLGHHGAMVGELEAAVAAEPLRERRWAQLMLALYRAGRQADALRAYGRLRATLADELGISPGPDLAALEHAILVQAPDLALPGWRRPGPPWPRAGASPFGVAGGAAGRGTVTFLYSAVDTTSESTGRSPEASGAMAQRHDELVGHLVEAHCGVSFRRPGEGLWARFTRVRDAVAAAVEAQAHDAPDEAGPAAGPRWRMAIHTAEAEHHHEGYYGPGVHLAARLQQAAHGGQVLLSAVSAALLEGHDGPPVEDLGLWSFPDVERPVRVHQLRSPHRFPALRFGRPASGAVPVVRTSLVARGDETAEVIAALAQSPVVTITGPGGVGKTRLALEVARRRQHDYRDGLWFVDLASATTASEVMDRTAATIGAAPAAGADPQVALIDLLRSTRLLLVLDNCEQIIEAVHEIVEAAIATGTEAQFLLTSRTPIASASERVVRLGPLALPAPGPRRGVDSPAVRLLVERARSAGASIDPGDPALARIAVRTDGIPLALELAARRLSSMTPADLAARLGDGLELLTASGGGGPRRQRSVGAAVEWSYDLLDPAQQSSFLALSVCEAGWTLETAESLGDAVGLPRRHAARLVADLADKSLVSFRPGNDGTARYLILETLREFGRHRLAEKGLRPAVADRHARYYVELVEGADEEARGPGEAAAVARLAAEFDNVRAACHWLRATSAWDLLQRLLGALAGELILRERYEIGRWATELATDARVGGHPLRALASAMAGNFALVEGRIEEGVALTRRALRPEPPGVGRWIVHSTMVLLAASGVVSEPVGVHLGALARISDDGGDPMGLALSLFDRALLLSFGDRPDSGLEPATQLVALGRAARNPTITSMGLVSVGRALGASAPDEARAPLHDALDLAVSVGGLNLAGQARRAIVGLDAARADTPRVRTGLRDLLAMFGAAGDRGQQLMTVLALLHPLQSIGAADLAVTLAAGLSATPLGGADSCQMILDTRATPLSTDEFHAAVEKGRTLVSPDDLTTFAVAALTALLGAGE